jgi:O-antigen ligase
MLWLFRPLIAAYLFMLVLLPSGSVFGLNLKMICFLLLLPLALQVAFSRRQIKARQVILLFGVPAVGLLWALYSQFYGFQADEAIAQYKDLMVTISTCWFAAVLCGEDRTETLFFLRWVIYAEVATSGLKVALLAYAFARGIPVSRIIAEIDTIFRVQLMAFDFESLLGRLQFISDNLIPICMFAILCYRGVLRIRGGRALLMLLLLLISDLFSFSRYLWVFTVVAIVCGLILGKKDRFQLTLITILSVAVFATLPLLITVVSLRFSSKVTTSSDVERTEQVAALQEFIADAPWLGHGLGSYTHRVIRSDTAPYSYEAQLLALIGQIGIVGVSLLVLLTGYYFRRLWPSRGRNTLRNSGLFLLLIGWIVGGFFNPSVISSAASVSYAAIFAMVALNDERTAGAELSNASV